MRAASVRAVLLFILFVALASAFVLFLPRSQSTDPRLAWVATAHQFGPVGYRDPAGAISPDGRWIAYSEGRFLRVRSVSGGPSVEFPPGDAQIRNLAWSPDSRSIVADGRVGPRDWAVYDRITATRRPLDPGGANARGGVTALVWSADGASLVGVFTGRHAWQLMTVAPDGALQREQTVDRPIAFPASTPRGQIACITTIDGRARITIPCGERPLGSQPDLDAYGPLAFSPDGETVYAGFSNELGTVDLWAVPTGRSNARQLTSLA